MLIYQRALQGNGSYYSTPRCSYCRKEGHNKSNCPHAIEDWESWKQHKVPLLTTNINTTYLKSPRYWGEWFLKCKDIVELQQRRKEQPLTRKTKLLKDIHCGFCGEKGHTRRNCALRRDYLSKAYAANKEWFKAAYKYINHDKQLSPGTMVKLKIPTGGYYSSKCTDAIGTIIDVNWRELNLAASEQMFHGWENGDYRQKLKIRVLVNGEIRNLEQKRVSNYDDSDRDGQMITDGRIFATESLDRNYASPIFNGILSKGIAIQIDGYNLFLGESNKAFDFITGKRNYEKLDSMRLTTAIQAWEPEENR